MHKITIPLKQHTPIIHFQHKQDGAALRATEIKPKLDRFIMGRFKEHVLQSAEEFKSDQELKDKLLKTINTYFSKDKKNKKYRSSYKLRVYAEVDYKLIIGSNIHKNQIAAINKEGKTRFLNYAPYFAEEEAINKKIFKTKKVEKKRNNKIVKDRNGNPEYETIPDSLFPEWEQNISNLGLMFVSNPSSNPGQKTMPLKLYIEVFSFHDDVLSLIKSAAPYFFAFESFGTRQNKGFGCFSVEEKKADRRPIENLLSSIFDYAYKTKNPQVNFYGAIRKINRDYKQLKSGINHNDYKKSLLFLYAVTKLEGGKETNGNKKKVPVRWEKRLMKQEINRNLFSTPNSFKQRSFELYSKTNRGPIFDENGTDSWSDPDDYFEYVRLALGMNEEFQFLTVRLNKKGEFIIKGNKKEKTPDHNKKYIAKIKSKGIDRYKSPITFKLYYGKIFVLANNMDPQIQAQLNEARFEVEYLFRNGKKNTELNIPSEGGIDYPKDFNIGDFLEFAFETYEGKERIKDYQRL